MAAHTEDPRPLSAARASRKSFGLSSAVFGHARAAVRALDLAAHCRWVAVSIGPSVRLEKFAPERDEPPQIEVGAKEAGLQLVGDLVSTTDDRAGQDGRSVAADWLVGEGEATELVRSKDWSQTSLGPIESWSESLRTAVSLVLASSFATNLIWGDGAVQIWNDAYALVCGERHPVMSEAITGNAGRRHGRRSGRRLTQPAPDARHPWKTSRCSLTVTAISRRRGSPSR